MSLTLYKFPDNNDNIGYIKYLNSNKNSIRFIRMKKCLRHENGFKVDTNFYQISNQINTQLNIFKHINEIGIEKGLIYHPEQLNNILNYKCSLYFKDNNIYIKHRNNIFNINYFLKNFVYNVSYEVLINEIICLHNNLSGDIKKIFLIYIGSIEPGNLIIEKLNLLDDNLINICFCFKNMYLYEYFKKKLVFRHQYLSIMKKKDYGNDIIPTLILYNKIKYIKPMLILKIHTKSNLNWLNNCLNYLLHVKEEEILNSLDYKNTLTYVDYNMSKNIDNYNSTLLSKYKKYLDLNTVFSAGCIFYCRPILLDHICRFLKENNYHSFFYNNFYDDNSINKDNSPYHFLERLFGYLKLKKKYDYNTFNYQIYLKNNKGRLNNHKISKIDTWIKLISKDLYKKH